jgi:hypothetical protein
MDAPPKQSPPEFKRDVVTAARREGLTAAEAAATSVDEVGFIDRIRGGNSVTVFETERGLLVTGGDEEVAEFVDVLLAEVGEIRTVRSETSDEPTGLAAVNPLARRRSEYVEFSSQAMSLIREKKLVPAAAGHFRSFVVKKGTSAGSVDWRALDLGPAKALALQGTVVQVALKLAIREVTDAIERVEGKVDQLLQLARAERLGSVKGDRRLLEPLAARAAESGAVSNSDWSTVAHLGADILRGIESFRDYVAREAADSKRTVFVRSRNAELEDLTSELLRESLALLVAAEDNYLLWLQIRVAHVSANERDALKQTLDLAEEMVSQLAIDDQRLINVLHAATLELIRPSGWEGLAPFKRKRMYENGEAIERDLVWFACQRHLDAPDIEAVFPSLRESVEHALARLTRSAERTGTTAQ